MSTAVQDHLGNDYYDLIADDADMSTTAPEYTGNGHQAAAETVPVPDVPAEAPNGNGGYFSDGTPVPEEPAAAPRKSSKRGGKGKTSKSDKSDERSVPLELAQLAMKHHDWVYDGGRLYGVPKDGAAIVLPIRGSGPAARGSVRQWMLREAATSGQIPGKDSISQALELIEALVDDVPEMPVNVRAGADRNGNGTWLDLGRADGECLHITPGSWEVRKPSASDVLFRRTNLISEIPMPIRPDGDDWTSGMGELTDLINLPDDMWAMAVGWLITTLFADIPCPVAFLLGEQGTGKSTATRLLRSVTDPAPAKVQGGHNNPRDMAPAVRNGWVYSTDNASTMPAWLADELCRLVTGDSKVNRELFTDDDVVVLQYRRPCIINSIDLAGLRADLADRMVPIRLDPIDASKRRGDKEIDQAFDVAHGRILGALATLASLVMAELPSAWDTATYRPRMIDYAIVLQAIDQITGSSGLRQYATAREALSSDVIHSSAVGEALISLVREKNDGEYIETPTKTLEELTFHGRGSHAPGWPRTSADLGGKLRRLAPDLRKMGWDVNLAYRPRDPNTGKQTTKYAFRAPERAEDA